MPENETASAGETTTESTATEGKVFEAIASQEDLDRIIQKRIERERARFSDYDDIKAKAAKFTELEDANKTESQKAADQLAAAIARGDALEAAAAEYASKALVGEVASAKGVPAALLTGSTKEELEAAADALIEFRGEQRQAPTSGALGRVNTSSVTDSDERAAARSLFGGN